MALSQCRFNVVYFQGLDACILQYNTEATNSEITDEIAHLTLVCKRRQAYKQYISGHITSNCRRTDVDMASLRCIDVNTTSCVWWDQNFSLTV